MALCSGQGSVMTDGAMQQGLQAFLTTDLPVASPGAPDLTLKALCWVRQLPSLLAQPCVQGNFAEQQDSTPDCFCYPSALC